MSNLLFSPINPKVNEDPIELTNLRLPICFSMFRNRGDNGINQGEIVHNDRSTWGFFAANLEMFSDTPFPTKEAAPLFSPARFAENHRLADNCIEAAMLAIDEDSGGIMIGQVVEQLREDGIEALIYTSASNKQGERFRVIVPLAEFVDGSKQTRAVMAFRDYLVALRSTGIGRLIHQN